MTKHPFKVPGQDKQYATYLRNGGEMGSLIRDYNWEASSMGHPSKWPKSLLVTLSILLNSRFPMFLWWGNDLVQFYNDAYRPSLGVNGKHPKALGQHGVDCWEEIWPIIYPQIKRVLETGEPTWNVDTLIPIYRNGRLEDVYWTYSYSPVPNDKGEICGVLVTCTETTDKVQNAHDLLESKNQLEFALDAADLGAWDYDPSNNRFTGNNKLRQLFGLLAEEALDLQVAISAIVPTDRQRVTDAIAYALTFTSGGLYDITYTVQNLQSGLESLVRARGKTKFDSSGNALRFSGTLQDITREKLSQDLLEASEQRTRAIIESAPFPIGVYIGREMRIALVNQSIKDVWGKGDDLVGRLYAEVLPELDGTGVYAQLDQVYTTGKSLTQENRPLVLVVNGEPRDFYFTYHFTPLFDAKGDVYGVMNTAADVTELNLAIEKQAQSERSIRNMIQQAPVGMYMVKGDDFAVETINGKMLEPFDKSVEEVEGKPFFEVILGARSFGREAAFKQVMTTGERFVANEKAMVVDRDGKTELYFFDVVYEPNFKSDGVVAGIFAVEIDITAKVTARKKIEELESRARLAIKAAKLGVYETDFTTGKVVADNRLLELFGMSGNIVWEDFSQAIYEEDRPIRSKAHAEAIKTGALDYEARILKNGSLSWIKVRGNVLYDESGTPQKILGIVQDISNQKQFSEALEKKVQERTQELAHSNLLLRQTNIELNEFAYIASHDLQEPLRKVRTFAGMLQETEAGLNKQSVYYLEKIQRSAERMQNLINDVLKFSILSKERENFAVVDLNKVLANTLVDYELKIEQTAATITSEDLPTIQAIPLQMRQLFTNLISNSLKFVNKKRPLQVNVSCTYLQENAVAEFPDLDPQQQYCQLVFKDNGIGFDEENANQIFNIFQRLHGRNEYEGTGIGLAMCKKIVVNHHGTIYAKATPGEGSSFFIILPVDQHVA